MSVYTNNDDELCCPLCGGMNTHVDQVAIGARPTGEDGPIRELLVDAGGIVTHKAGVPTGRWVGAGRRHRFALIGWCEMCDGKFALVFTQHKGVTLTESVNLTPDADLLADPIPLRQGPPPSRLGSLIPGVLRDLVARHSRRGAA